MSERSISLFDLRRVPLFAQLPPNLLQQIADAMDDEEHAPGTLLFKQGDSADALYVVVDGEVAILVDGVVVNSMHAPAAFGEVALLDHGPRTAGAKAMSDVHVLRLPAQSFEDLLERLPSLRTGMLAALAERLLAINARENGTGE